MGIGWACQGRMSIYFFPLRLGKLSSTDAERDLIYEQNIWKPFTTSAHANFAKEKYEVRVSIEHIDGRVNRLKAKIRSDRYSA